MKAIITIEQLEQMKTHEVADLLANVVMMLRRMPDVPCIQLQVQEEPPASIVSQQETPKRRTTKKKDTQLITEEQPELQASSLPIFTEVELQAKKVVELKAIVTALHIPTSAKKKDELISKILMSQGREHSEQYTILNA